MDFKLRDAGAVAYTKSMLIEGDTLVLIKNPRGNIAYDATGFPLATKLRVQSRNLLATGSPKFKKMFEPIQQARYRRTNKLTRDTDLPLGVQYVIDLSPPDEGDDAVEQISNLSCPKGIIYWSTASGRCGISVGLIGGKDEVSVSLNENQSALSQPFIEREPDNGTHMCLLTLHVYCC